MKDEANLKIDYYVPMNSLYLNFKDKPTSSSRWGRNVKIATGMVATLVSDILSPEARHVCQVVKVANMKIRPGGRGERCILALSQWEQSQ